MTVTLQDYSFKDIALKTHTRTYKIRELVKALVLNVFYAFKWKLFEGQRSCTPSKYNMILTLLFSVVALPTEKNYADNSRKLTAWERDYQFFRKTGSKGGNLALYYLFFGTDINLIHNKPSQCVLHHFILRRFEPPLQFRRYPLIWPSSLYIFFSNPPTFDNIFLVISPQRNTE